MRINLFVTLFLITVSATYTNAQDNWAVSIKGDSITGKMFLDLRDQYSHDHLRVKNDSGKFYILPREIKRVSIKGTTYIPLMVYGKQQFAKVVQEGYLSLYFIRGTEPETSSQFIQQILVKSTGEQQQISLLTFKKVVKKFLSDCVTESKFESSNDYKLKNINGIMDEYNDCIKDKREKTTQVGMVVKEIPDFKIFIDKIQSSKVDGKEDIIDMVSDVENKIAIGKKIPTYLTNAIQGALQMEEQLSKDFQRLIETHTK